MKALDLPSEERVGGGLTTSAFEQWLLPNVLFRQSLGERPDGRSILETTISLWRTLAVRKPLILLQALVPSCHGKEKADHAGCGPLRFPTTGLLFKMSTKRPSQSAADFMTGIGRDVRHRQHSFPIRLLSSTESTSFLCRPISRIIPKRLKTITLARSECYGFSLYIGHDTDACRCRIARWNRTADKSSIRMSFFVG